ncbi:hypothetical protein, partial [Acinetobacter pittii]|uniref:hypothetical protein n=1 Tax=Acinetobacter pittii TaxID=48296 RepID=UPI000A346317
EIAEVHILKADIFTLEKPDISILELQTTVRIMYIMLNKRFGKLLPYIRLWLLYVATTPFMLHYTELLKACSTASVAQAI